MWGPRWYMRWPVARVDVLNKFVTTMWNELLTRTPAAPRSGSASCRSADKCLGTTARKPKAIFVTVTAFAVFVSIFTCRASRSGCVKVGRIVRSGLLRPLEVQRIVRAPLFDEPFRCEVRLATGCECQGATLCLPGKIWRMNWSKKDMPTSESFARLRTISNQILVRRTSIMR